jgi:hypothetical protein
MTNNRENANLHKRVIKQWHRIGMTQKPEKENLHKYDNILEYITIKINTMDIKNY